MKWILFLSVMCWSMAGLANGPVGSSDKKLQFPSVKYAQITGPNCFGTSLAVTGLAGGVITDWSWALDLILKSPFCNRVQKEEARYGDIGAIRNFGGGLLGSDLAHAMTFLTANQVFQKGSFETDSPFETIRLSDVCRKYPMEGVCPRATPAFYLEVYRCQRVDYSSLKRGSEVDQRLREVEALVERLALSKDSLTSQENASLSENLQLIRDIGVINQLSGAGVSPSLVFFQQLIWRRLMNIKTQLHVVSGSHFSKTEISKALQEALESVAL